MIKPVRAWQDSQGVFHQSRDAACQAEFRRLLIERLGEFMFDYTEEDQEPLGVITIDALVAKMFEVDRIFGEATKEDARVEMIGSADA